MATDWICSLGRGVMNFDKDMILGVFMGQKSTGGFAVKITRVEKYEIEKSNLPVIFKKVEENKK